MSGGGAKGAVIAVTLLHTQLITQHKRWGRESEEKKERKRKECQTKKVLWLKFVLRFCLL